jgi:hypothetical protein
MILHGQYIDLTDITAVEPLGFNMNKCRVTFKSGATATITGYEELMTALTKE